MLDETTTTNLVAIYPVVSEEKMDEEMLIDAVNGHKMMA